MSNLNPERHYSSLPEALAFVLEQFVKTLNICLPANIVTYDAATRRASVQPAIYTMLTDGALIEPPIIGNVPVVWPGGGGFVATCPLAGRRCGDPGVQPTWADEFQGRVRTVTAGPGRAPGAQGFVLLSDARPSGGDHARQHNRSGDPVRGRHGVLGH